jgi:hypothetical protein
MALARQAGPTDKAEDTVDPGKDLPWAWHLCHRLGLSSSSTEWCACQLVSLSADTPLFLKSFRSYGSFDVRTVWNKIVTDEAHVCVVFMKYWTSNDTDGVTMNGGPKLHRAGATQMRLDHSNIIQSDRHQTDTGRW